MPLNPKASMSTNISEIMRSYKSKGTIGNSKPKNDKRALKQALAIAYKEKGERK